MIKVENLGLKRDDWLFKGVSFSIPQGELIGIIGESGVGKTSLLKLIAGFVDANEGAIYFEEERIVGPSVKLIPGYEDLQLVNQDFELDLFHTVEENIREKVLHLPKSDQHALVNELLELIELDGIKHRKAKLLSGGEKQRLSIARALACEPKVILLDEPFVHLDQRLRLNFIHYLQNLNKIRNTTIILVSHDGAEMLGFVDKIIHLANGGVQRICNANEMYYSSQNFEQGLLLGLINQIKVAGKHILFRPNEFELNTKTGVRVKFIRSFDTGLLVFNDFKTENNEFIVLSSNKPLNDVKFIKISKRG